MVSIICGVGRFESLVMVAERGDATSIYTEKAYEQDLVCLKDRCVLLGINCLKNALWSCVVDMHMEVTN
jgi:hypothetical protein